MGKKEKVLEFIYLRHKKEKRRKIRNKFDKYIIFVSVELFF